jgi:hypothetical protein
MITVDAVRDAMGKRQVNGTEVKVATVDLRLFDELCGADEPKVVQ